MGYLVIRAFWSFSLVLATWSIPANGKEPGRVLGSPEIPSSRPAYRNYALQHYSHYPDHAFPYVDAPRAYYGSMGDYLISGYDLFAWEETRVPGLEWGSAVYKDRGIANDRNAWVTVFDSMVMGRDGYGDWGYSLIVGDALIARFTPLTLSKVDFSGVRLDVSTPHLKITSLGSRVERPGAYLDGPALWALERTHIADDSTLLLGGRAQADLGLLQAGFNWVNQHVYQSTQPGNSLMGRLRPDRPLIDWILVRFADDSPLDGVGGAVVQEVQLIVNGAARPDLPPQVVRQQAGATSQVGRILQATGRFRPTNYNTPNVHDSDFDRSNFYREREIPLYADYFYRLDHSAGADVSKATNLEGLLASFTVETAAGVLRADGDEQVVFLFDVSQEPVVESVEVEALLGNDYRVEVALLNTKDPRGKTYYQRYRSSFLHVALRAKGNVQDMSNLKRVRFEIAEHTGHFAYGADVRVRLVGLEVLGEYARSSLYARYPGQLEGTPTFDKGPRFAERGSAYYLNATRWFGRGRVGGEFFAINPEFQTEIRTFLDWNGLNDTNLGGMAHQTIYWQLVEDNEDGDPYPDRRLGNLPGLVNDAKGYDIDGVFIGQDEDNDGTPDINRNLNDIPDFEEPFLMYDVEPNAYVFGLDRNHNDEPDFREDDGEVDYPYDYDQRGYHLFGQWDLDRHWSAAVGRHAVEQIAGSGRNRSTYGLLSFRREGLGRLRRLVFENHLRQVQDDIADEYVVMDEIPLRNANFGAGGLSHVYLEPGIERPPHFVPRFRRDQVLYQDSYINETYLEGRLKPWSTLDVVQRIRLRLNWQQGGQLYNGLFQRERRLDFWTWVSRVEYTWHWGKLNLTPQYKFMLLRLIDRERDLELQSEVRSIPLLRLTWPLLSRTTLRAAIQGPGPLPYRREDRVAMRNSFDQHTMFITLTNRSKYFGYELVTIVGINRDKKEFDTHFQDFRSFDTWALFARALVGFTEDGRLY